jgi:hypothetical protein
MLRTRQRYQPAEKLAMVEYLPLGGDNITTRGIYRRSVEATYAEFGSLVVDVRQPVSVFDVLTRA